MIFEDQHYLNSQNGTMRLDKFTHTLIVKCSVEVSDKVVSDNFIIIARNSAQV